MPRNLRGRLLFWTAEVLSLATAALVVFFLTDSDRSLGARVGLALVAGLLGMILGAFLLAVARRRLSGKAWIEFLWITNVDPHRDAGLEKRLERLQEDLEVGADNGQPKDGALKDAEKT